LKLAVRATWNDPIGIAWSKIGTSCGLHISLGSRSMYRTYGCFISENNKSTRGFHNNKY